ncbi:sensor histidine kinase [Bacillus paramycoides]|uniref:sensor histidine kinase n=1 Tax=Bacillus paramycoides TaxID=2026194 RepID=UPI003CFDBD67
MKWKVTGLYITSLIILILFILIVQVFVIGYFASTYNTGEVENSEKEVINFQKEIVVKENNIAITQEGKEFLEDRKGWIQILDKSGNEVYQWNKPANIPVHYTLSEIVFRYKYSVDDYTTFVSKLDKSEQLESYVIAFPVKQVYRWSTYFNLSDIKSIYPYGILISLLVSGVCILIFAYFIARYMSQPLVHIIQYITNLKNEKYSQIKAGRGIYRDVYTSLSQLSKQLQNVNQERETLEQMRGEWIVNISHDLKTPLSSIKGYSEIMMDPDYQINKQEMHEYAKIIENKANYIEQLINDLKLTYQLKNGIIPLQKNEVDIIELIRETIISVINMPNFEEKQVELECKAKSIKTEIDQNLIQRVIMNLLVNAFIHNEETVLVTVKIKLISKNKLCITIKDNGQGIKEADLPYIFDRYFRGTNTENISGTGLGMAIVKEIILAHQGEIYIESEEGKGTKVMIYIPVLN